VFVGLRLSLVRGLQIFWIVVDVWSLRSNFVSTSVEAIKHLKFPRQELMKEMRKGFMLDMVRSLYFRVPFVNLLSLKTMSVFRWLR
jgi:uncharacterized protein involved in cysteine biosynthesis